MKKTNQTNGTLYIVSTSIGNKKDITIRATEVLQNCDIIVGEEMKEASRVLMHLNLSKPIELLNEHNEKEKVEELIDLLQEGKSIALISDCGTPIFADPGIELLRSALSKEIDITVVPGSSSIMTAMVRSGFDLKRFFYAGFLNRNSKERIKEIQDLSSFPYTIIVMDTPYRLKVLLEDFAKVMPLRKAYIGMNLTMQSETHHYGTFSELYEKFKSTRTRNEYVLVIEGNLIGNINSVQDTFEIDKQEKPDLVFNKHIENETDEDTTLPISAEETDTTSEFGNETETENIENDDYLELSDDDGDFPIDDDADIQFRVEQIETTESRNRDDRRESKASNRNESESRIKRRDDTRRSEGRRSDRGDSDRRGRESRRDDRRSESRREGKRDKFRRDDDRQSSRRNDSNRGGNDRRNDNFRDNYRRDDNYNKDDRPRREEDSGGFRRSNSRQDEGGRRRNDDFRGDDRRRGRDYRKDDRNKRDDYRKDNNRKSRDRFDDRPRRQDDYGTNHEMNYEEKRERANRSENFESRDRNERKSYDSRSQSKRGSNSERGSNRGRRSENSSNSKKRPRRKKE